MNISYLFVVLGKYQIICVQLSEQFVTLGVRNSEVQL